MSLRTLPLAEGVRRRPGLVLLGLVPPGWGAQSRPIQPASTLVTDAGPVHLYVLRARHPEELRRLPGLEQRDAAGSDHPSRMRDAATLALLNTSDAVEIALVELPDRLPWELDALPPAAWSLLDRYLELRPGAVLVWPDATGPEGAPDAWARLVRNLRGVGRLLTDRYQLLLADAPPNTSDTDAVRALFGLDAAVCTWVGSEVALARHGWRSGAAAVGATLSAGFSGLEGSGNGVVPALIGQHVRLGEGRAAHADHVHWGRTGDPPPPAVPAELVGLAIEGDRGHVLQDPTLREPIGAWALPALWVTRQFVRRVTEIAQQFVFTPLEPYSAQALRSALSTGIANFRHVGAAEGIAHPVSTAMVRDPAAPRLEATLTVAIRPWIRRIRVDVTVAPDRGVAVAVG